jgi:hypothetical protein
MKLGNWVAVLGCLGLGFSGIVAAQGCTVTACTGAACNGIVDFDTGTFDYDSGPIVGEDAGLVDTGSTAPDPCNSCLYGQCVGLYSNCVGNSSCLGIYQCATAAACSTDGTCVQNCFNAGTATAQALYLALGECDQAAECTNITPSAACAATCNPPAASCVVAVVPDDAGATDAGSSGVDSSTGSDDSGTTTSPADAGLSCSACVATSCSAQVAQCATGTPCATYNQCLGGCADTACDTACTSAYPQGATAAAALGSCTSTNCAQCFSN